MQVLVCLAELSGEVVTREDLIARVWPGVFVTDDVLHRAIRELRRVFGDSSSAPRYIETIRKRGYRLMQGSPALPATSAPPGDFSPSAAPPPLPSTSVHEGDVAAGNLRPPTARSIHAPWRFVALAAAVGLTCAAAVLAIAWRPAVLATEAHARFVPVVSGPLNESDPAVSHDGLRVAFVQREAGDAASADIYVRTLSDGQTVRLTTDPASDRMPAWSPDGARLAFIRMSSSTCDVYIRVLNSSEETRVAPCGNHEDPRVAWTRDARALLMSHATAQLPLSSRRIVRMSLDTSAMTSITEPPAGLIGDESPSVSPDGRSIAFIRRASGGVS
ncbi:MAG: winged helix-turn-helix domain-containing protein, partial [Planctomycetota bacterium]|nr:winged helix-turn-helix domain-containing protein [Planctomycetota bacterium]